MIAWIKVETTLPQKPELLKLSLRLRIPRREAIGLCIEFWLWADSVAREDGVLRGADEESLDAIFGQPGFAAAMRAVGWLEDHPDGFAVPNWTKHNSRSTKARLAAARRKAKSRWGRSHDEERF